jgi:hypothetical protein
MFKKAFGVALNVHKNNKQQQTASEQPKQQEISIFYAEPKS